MILKFDLYFVVFRRVLAYFGVFRRVLGILGVYTDRSTASRAECFIVGVGVLADGELARRLLRRSSGVVDGQVVRRPRLTELLRRHELSRRSEPPSRYELSPLF